MSAPASSSSTSPSADGNNGPRPSARRDQLLDIERKVQKEWEEAKVFDVEAGDAKTRDPQDKYLATFPYPYMNGVLHLGHGFTLAKVDFECAYQRLKGKNVLFPFGYHTTGMPICAAADKLKREIAAYGCPPKFPEPPKEDAPEELIENMQIDSEKEKDQKKDDSASASSSSAAAPKKKGGKSKVASKASKETYQWNILREMGVPESEIPKFADAKYWLTYFPPIATRHLKAFGLSADFRRSFITTDINPYYDSFVRWQFNTLRKKEKVAFGGRLSIFSPIDNQTCADHDRAEGEGVDLMEYTLIRVTLQKPYPQAVVDVLGDKYANATVVLPAATLRPETMYGQTNIWMLPDGEYGLYEMASGDIFGCSPKSALNMAYQGLTKERGKAESIGKVKGINFIGCAVKSPMAKYDVMYCLPLTTIKMEKGTAVVTSVPSDAPDDYAALMDLKNKAPFREKYGLKDDQVLPFEVVPIIETPGLGMQPAKDLCIEKKVASQNDRVKLEEIKDKVYKEGFAKGIMRVGKHAGEKVSEAKPKIKAEMIEAGDAFNYAEPERRVVSRSGNECVVALADQWYLKYGEANWQKLVRDHVETTLECYNPQTKKDFLGVVDWLHEWACSRSYGLGTYLPWDPQYVIESLSDSTIYMAYYTIAHWLQGAADGTSGAQDGNFLTGKKHGLLDIPAEALTDDVWNYIFLSKDYPDPLKDCSIPIEKLQKLRNDFEYWYPMDLRVSGKDLVGNHLTMSLYNHAAIWEDSPEKWPRSFFTNGHVMIDNAKMSKSTGNFVTLKGACEEYSADATRFALADAGDGLEEANFERKSANAAILKLTKEEAWIREAMAWDAANPDKPMRSGELTFWDRACLNEFNACIHGADAAYSKLQFRDALKYSFHQLTIERDNYKLALDAEKTFGNLHRDVVMKYVECLALLLAPLCPHFCQHIWTLTGLDQRPTSNGGAPQHFVMRARWPAAEPVDVLLQRQSQFLRDTNANIRKSLIDSLIRFGKAGKKGGKVEKWIADIAAAAQGGLLVPSDFNKLIDSCTLYIAPNYPEWQAKVLRLVDAAWEEVSGRRVGEYPDRKMMLSKLREIFDPKDKKAMENSTKFACSVLEDLVVRGAAALELESPFQEDELLSQHMDFVTRDLGIQHIELKRREQGPDMPPQPPKGQQMTPEAMAQSIEALAAGKSMPGRPQPYFYKKQ